MSTLTISEPLPTGPGKFEATAFTAQALSSPGNLAAILDHTLSKPDATRAQVIQHCHEAAEYHFACAMVSPTWVSLAASALQGTGVPVGVFIGFPLGATLSASKRDETIRVLKQGAHDIDMVMNIGLLKSGEVQRLRSRPPGYPRSRRARPRLRSHRQGHPGDLPPHLRGETPRLRARPQRRGRLPQDQHRLLHRRSHSRRHLPATRRSRPPRWCQSIRRHSLPRRCHHHAPGRCLPHRSQRQRQNRHRTQRSGHHPVRTCIWLLTRSLRSAKVDVKPSGRDRQTPQRSHNPCSSIIGSSNVHG